jgi:hypothetical protein
MVPLEAFVEDLLRKYAIVDVLKCIAKIMQEPGGDSTNMVLVGKVIEDLTEINLDH